MTFFTDAFCWIQKYFVYVLSNMIQLDMLLAIQIIAYESLLQLNNLAGMLNQRQLINSFIYSQMQRPFPTRYEMITYSKKRMYFYHELQLVKNKQGKFYGNGIKKHFDKLYEDENDHKFYDFMLHLNQLTEPYHKDNYSHFICRMIYCQTQRGKEDFIQSQRKILEIKLKQQHSNHTTIPFLASLLSQLVQKDLSKYMLSAKQRANIQLWSKIIQGCPCASTDKKFLNEASFIKLPFDLAQYSIRRRRAYLQGGFAYVSKQSLIEIILNQYTQYLKAKLILAQKQLAILLQQDNQKQIYYFLTETLDKINQTSIQEIQLQNNQRLTLKNVEAVWNKYFPPCMLVLTEALKAKSHLKHQGRRQLWLFFKACGMSSLDNQQFFRRHMAHKVSDSDMKSHIYNIQHAYGQVGKKQPQHSKICRNIITGQPPKKDEYHGCPFRHWGETQLSQLLRRKYRISEQSLTEIMQQKKQNHYQVACGRLFESNEINKKLAPIPEQILNQLGRSPQSYYSAGMELVNRNQKKKPTSIELHKTAEKMQVQEMF